MRGAIGLYRGVRGDGRGVGHPGISGRGDGRVSLPIHLNWDLNVPNKRADFG
jgi:hypothetical protein